jgi:hypothetical protein
MIVSPSLRMLYVKPRKVAGTSVELALSPHLAPGDRATPVGRDERLRSAAPGVEVGLIRGRGWQQLRDHSPLSRAVRVLGREVLDWRIVTTERNPWDRAVSQFFWSLRRTDIRDRPFAEQKREFEVFVRRWGPVTWLDAVYGRKRQRSLSSVDLYTLDGEVMADRVLFFERLAEDMAALGSWLGLAAPLQLPPMRTKSDSRPRSRPDWREFYSDALRDFVGECCAREIALFGYAFDPTVQPAFSPRRPTPPGS